MPSPATGKTALRIGFMYRACNRPSAAIRKAMKWCALWAQWRTRRIAIALTVPQPYILPIAGSETGPPRAAVRGDEWRDCSGPCRGVGAADGARDRGRRSGAWARPSTSARCSARRVRPPARFRRRPHRRRSRAAVRVPEWSGESGASGHPLMQADAIRAAAANFRNCLEGSGRWPRAAACRGPPSSQRRPVSRPICGSWICSTRSPSSPSRSGTISISWSATRASRTAARSWRSHRATFDAVEKAYGVDRYIIAAIWGVESNYSTQVGDRSVHPLDRDARLHRPPAGLFPRGISLRARDPRARRRAGRIISRARGRARSARRSSCRRRSSASRSTSTATAGATSSTRSPISSPRPRTISRRTAGSPARPGATRSSCRPASISCSPTARAR